jgi:phage shock protein PspC (stress-responsive transcriptional regulator)
VLRLAFVVGALFSALGPAVILYVVLWVIMPLDESDYFRGEVAPRPGGRT